LVLLFIIDFLLLISKWYLAGLGCKFDLFRNLWQRHTNRKPWVYSTC